jgi:hypothetical protein
MASDDYEVGYKRPPKRTQFKKGQSGNPRGRQAGARNFETDLREELAEPLRVREPGKRPYSVTKQRAVLKRLFSDAVSGKPQSIKLVFDLINRSKQDDQPFDAEGVVTLDDQEIVKGFIRRYLSREDQEEEK